MLPPPARLLLLALLAPACDSHQPPALDTASPAAMLPLEGTWLISSEESGGDTLVYRPNTYRFPPTRGRTGFAIGPYGRFRQFDLAPTDGLTARPGTWTAAGAAQLRIHLHSGPQPDYTLEILSLNQRVLKLRQRAVAAEAVWQADAVR